jgi:hypothetical protein
VVVIVIDPLIVAVHVHANTPVVVIVCRLFDHAHGSVDVHVHVDDQGSDHG